VLKSIRSDTTRVRWTPLASGVELSQTIRMISWSLRPIGSDSTLLDPTTAITAPDYHQSDWPVESSRVRLDRIAHWRRILTDMAYNNCQNLCKLCKLHFIFLFYNCRIQLIILHRLRNTCFRVWVSIVKAPVIVIVSRHVKNVYLFSGLIGLDELRQRVIASRGRNKQEISKSVL